MSAMQDAFDRMEVDARKLVSGLTKRAARRYRDRPSYLDAISYGLSRAEPRTIIAVCDHIQERGTSERIGIGSGMVRPVNLRGARLYARWYRRFGARAEAFFEAAE